MSGRTILVLACLAVVTASGARPAAGVELGRRYIDPIHGFSLRPPAGAQRLREAGSARLVSWRKRDDESGAVLWTLSLLQAVERNPVDDVAAYAKALSERLRRQESYKVDRAAVAKVDGKPAIVLSGVAISLGKLYQKQVWVRTEQAADGEATPFLVLVMTGPRDMSETLDDMLDDVLETMKVTDPAEARRERKARLQRGQDLLAELAVPGDHRLERAVQDEQEWYLFEMKGDVVGWMRTAARTDRVEESPGIRVRSWVVLDVPDAGGRLLKKRDLFSSPDRNVEKYTEVLQQGEGPDAVRVVEEGLKQDDMIVVTVRQGERTQTQSKEVPEEFYLPRAMGAIIGRLADRSKPASYGFAVYVADVNSFDMRTFTVVGEEKVEIGGEQVTAVRATDRLAEDAEPAQLWLDGRGRVLLMRSADGLAMRAVKETEVLRRFPDARDMLKAMGD